MQWLIPNKCLILIVIEFVVAVQFLSRVSLFATPWTAAHQASLSITISWSFLKLMSIEQVMPSNYLILCRPLLLLPSIFPIIRFFFPMSQLFASSGQSIGTSALASVLPVNIQGWFPLRLTGLISLLSKRLSRVFSSTEFKSINSLVQSLHYDPTLTSTLNCWKNHSFDCMDLCWQSDVSAF